MEDALPRVYFDVAGYVGVAAYILAFALLQAGVIRGTGYVYIIMNIAAAALVLLSLVVAFNLSSAIIQTSWIVIGLFGLTRRYIHNRRTRFSEAEERMRAEVFPGADPVLVRRFIDAGEWTTLPAGAVMCTEGDPVQTLFFLSEGEAEAVCGGQTVGLIRHGFVGEMNVLQAGPASATVSATTDSRVFVISGEGLRAMCKRDEDMRAILENGFNRDTRAKLNAANTRLRDAQQTAKAG